MDGFDQAEESLIAQYANEVKGGLQAPLVRDTFLARSGYTTSRNRIAFLSAMILPNQDLGASLFKTKVTRYVRFFSDFMTPITYAQNVVKTEAEARHEVMRQLKALFVIPGQGFNPDMSEFYMPAPQQGNDPRPVAMQQMDANITAINTDPLPANAPANLGVLIGQMADYAWELPGSRTRKFFYKYMVTNLITLAKTGQITEVKLDSMSEQIKEELKISLDVSTEDVQQLFRALVLVMKEGPLNPVKIMRGNFAQIGLDDASRFYLTMTQSIDSGVTGVTVVADAMAKFPTSRIWKYLEKETTTELQRWTQAARIVGGNGYICFEDHTVKELVKSTLFPNVFYGARQLLMELGGETNIRQIKTATKANKKIFIDRLIEADKNDAIAGINSDTYKYGPNESIYNLTGDIGQVLQTVTLDWVQRKHRI